MPRALSLVLVLLLLSGCPENPPNKPAPGSSVGSGSIEGAGSEGAGSAEDPDGDGGLKIEEDHVDADLGSEPLVAGEGERLVTFSVDGMSCINCARSTYEALTGVEHVARVRVSYDERRAWVVTKGSHDPAALVAAAKKEGFTLVEVAVGG